MSPVQKPPTPKTNPIPLFDSENQFFFNPIEMFQTQMSKNLCHAKPVRFGLHFDHNSAKQLKHTIIPKTVEMVNVSPRLSQLQIQRGVARARDPGRGGPAIPLSAFTVVTCTWN